MERSEQTFWPTNTVYNHFLSWVLGREQQRPFLILSLKVSLWHGMTTSCPGLTATLHFQYSDGPDRVYHNDLLDFCKLSSLPGPFCFTQHLLVVALGQLPPFFHFQRWLHFYSFMHLSPDSFRAMKVSVHFWLCCCSKSNFCWFKCCILFWHPIMEIGLVYCFIFHAKHYSSLPAIPSVWVKLCYQYLCRDKHTPCPSASLIPWEILVSWHNLSIPQPNLGHWEMDFCNFPVAVRKEIICVQC